MLSPYAYKMTRNEREQKFAEADGRVKQLEAQQFCGLCSPYDVVSAPVLAALEPEEGRKMGLSADEIGLLSYLYDGPNCEQFARFPGCDAKAENVARTVESRFGDVVQDHQRLLKYWRGVRSRNKLRM